ncbi:MAG: hypothetical protein JWM11_4268 [Planctomycetaceae bacterium]|nr:hypothetical protein [Planctomycetaceae bacterium]
MSQWSNLGKGMNPEVYKTLDLPAQVRIMQIIVGALMIGIILFMGIGCIVAFGPKEGLQQQGVGQPNAGADAANGKQDDSLPIIACFGAVMAGISILARFVVPGIVVQGAIRTSLRGRPIETVTKADFVPIYQTTLIVASALLEGAALFIVIGVIIDHQIWSLGIVGFLILLMGAGIPTVEKVDAWTEEQLRNFQLNPPVPSNT